MMSAFGEPVKYEADPKSGRLRVETFMMTGVRYPANYGFVPDTLAPDGRPLDVLVVAPFPIVPGAFVEVRALGTMHLTNERGPDAKIVAVPVNDVWIYWHWKTCPDCSCMNSSTSLSTTRFLSKGNGRASSTAIYPMMPRASCTTRLRRTGRLPAIEAGETLIYLWSSERCRTSRCARSLLINAA